MKISSVRFRFHFVSELRFLGNYFLAKFHEILMSGSLENSSFPQKQPVTNFWSNAHAWLLIGFHGKDEKHAKRLHELTFLLGNQEKEFKNEKLSCFKNKI